MCVENFESAVLELVDRRFACAVPSALSARAASGPRRSVRGYRRALPVLGPIEPLDLTVHRKTSHGLSLVYLRLGRVQTGLEVVFIGTRK